MNLVGHSRAQQHAVIPLDRARSIDLRVHTEIRTGIVTEATQYPGVIRQIGLGKIHHDAALREISNPQDDLPDLKRLPEPKSFHLSHAGEINQHVWSESTVIEMGIREEHP